MEKKIENTPKPSRNEDLKKNSKGLRGTITSSLENKITGALFEDDQDIIKFHGIYSQDDRDRRADRANRKLERLYSYMIRLRIPGGVIDAKKWIIIHETANQYSTGIIKITTRQTIQLHGIIKSKIKPTLKNFNLVNLDSIAACGDVNRNVICSAHPALTPCFNELQNLADKISLALLPKTRAYYEIWLNEEPLFERTEEDPLYQDRYLPRKFKVAIAIPPLNDVDVFANDIGIIPIIERKKIQGYNISVGGGLGTTHGNKATYPRLGTEIGFVSGEDNLMKVIYEIVTIQRDFGNRSDRKLSRLKYTLDKMGVDVFKRELEKRSGISLEIPRLYSFLGREDYYGWKKDHSGNWHYTLFIENGRILDYKDLKIKSALLEIAQKFDLNFRFTANQHLILGDISDNDKEGIQRLLEKFGLNENTENASHVRKNSMACVAFNTCPLALAEGQRYLPQLLDKVEVLLTKHDLIDQKLNIRMTGCPNGCARPFMAEIGLVGTSYGKYNLYYGGSPLGTRLNTLYKENLEEKDILLEIDGKLRSFKVEKEDHESIGDFLHRKIISMVNTHG